MADDLKNSGRPDRDRINVNEDHELRYWTRELGVSEAELRQLVARNGTAASDIREALRKK